MHKFRIPSLFTNKLLYIELDAIKVLYTKHRMPDDRESIETG